MVVPPVSMVVATAGESAATGASPMPKMGTVRLCVLPPPPIEKVRVTAPRRKPAAVGEKVMFKEQVPLLNDVTQVLELAMVKSRFVVPDVYAATEVTVATAPIENDSDTVEEAGSCTCPTFTELAWIESTALLPRSPT